MAKPGFHSVDEYLAAQPRAARPVLAQVRATISEALPGATETISYQMPAYRVAGRVAVYFAGWKKHFSLYPVTPEIVASFRDELAPYDVNEKGTVRFPLDEPVPVALVAAIARKLGEKAEAATAAKAPRAG